MIFAKDRSLHKYQYGFSADRNHGSNKSSKHGYVAGQKRQGRWVLGSVQVAREIMMDR